MPIQRLEPLTSNLQDKPAVVLDTNATLDWLVFGDVHMRTLGAAIAAGKLHWLATPAMRAELARVLGYDNLARWAPDAPLVLSTFDRLAQLCDEPPFCGWRCADSDDQVFIDLAVAQQAAWLVTHDRALLTLARRVRGRLAVIKPGAWCALGDGVLVATDKA
jgi:uncharacterized protein